MGLGWLRAVAQGYNYIHNKIKLQSNFQMNLKSWVVKWGWGLDMLQLQLQSNLVGYNFQMNLMSWGVNWGWGLDGCVRWRKVTSTITQT